MPLFDTTSYRLPSLGYLRPGKLVATCIYVGLYYAVGLVLLTIFINEEMYRAYGPSTWFLFSILLLVGINVMWQLTRIAVAVASKWQWRDQTVVAQYELDISPLEAVILLKARSPRDIVQLLLQSLVTKNVIRLVPAGRKIQIVDCYEIEKPLYYYEDYLAGLLLKDGASPKMSRWQLLHGRHVRQVERHVYDKLKWRGYFAKQSPLQEGLGQYLYIGSYAVMVVLLPLLFQLPHADDAQGFAISQGEGTAAIVTLLVVTLIVPFLVYVRSVYTRQGTEKMSLALGFYWYLRTVYKHRLASGKYTLSTSEEKQYGPYLDAFGLRKRSKLNPSAEH